MQRNYFLRTIINKIFRYQNPAGHNHLFASENFIPQNSLINYFHHKTYIVKLLSDLPIKVLFMLKLIL